MSLRQKLRNNKPIIGIMIQDLVDPILIPLLSECGYDFIVLDQEHGPSTYQDVQNLSIVTRKEGIALVVRATNISHEYISKILDMGADGLMIPHVDTIEQVQEVIKWAKYPPVGERSWGMRKILSKVDEKETNRYINSANDWTTIFIQVESPKSVNNVNDLVSRQFIDGVIIGPADLSMNMGIMGKYTSDEFVTALEKVLTACKDNKKGFGIHFGDIALALDWKEKGANILLHGNVKQLIMQKGRETVSALLGDPRKRESNQNSGSPY